MIVKNEAHNLERCLNSLNQLRTEVSSELIIVDTGSTDRTVEIAKKYTDKVHFHEWNNHFSYMRNISIRYATGDWVMIIDADEELIDPESLIRWLKTESFDSPYNALILKMKDFTKGSDLQVFSEYLSPRLFKNDGYFKYEGRVHNQAVYKEPSRVVEGTMLYHYGYDSDNESLMSQKVERTSKLLLQELEMDPRNIYYLYQLSAIYRMGNQYENSFDAIDKAFKLIPESKLNEYAYVVKHYALLLRDQKKGYEIIQLEKAINAKMNVGIDLCYIFAEAYEKLNYSERAKFYYLQYLEQLEVQKNSPNVEANMAEATITGIYEPMVYIKLVKISEQLKDNQGVLQYFFQVKSDKYTESLIYTATRGALNLSSIEELERIVQLLMPLELALKNQVINCIEDFRKEKGEANLLAFQNQAKKLNPAYEILCLARNLYISGQKVQTNELIQFFENYFSTKYLYYSEFLYFALVNDSSILDVLIKRSNKEIEEIANYLSQWFKDFKTLAIRLIEKNNSFEGLRLIACIEWVLLSMDRTEEIDKSLGFDLLLNKIEGLYRTYERDIIEQQPALLSGRDRSFAIINQMILGLKEEEFIREVFSEESSEPWQFLIDIVVENHESLLEEIKPMRGVNFE